MNCCSGFVYYFSKSCNFECGMLVYFLRYLFVPAEAAASDPGLPTVNFLGLTPCLIFAWAGMQWDWLRHTHS